MTEEFKLIPLSRGQVAIVDVADYEWLSRWKWHAMPRHAGGFYAARNSDYVRGERRHHIWMHRAILGLGPGDRSQADHVNRNTLDNRRSNLRIANGSQNMMNRSLFKNNGVGFTGVHRAKTGKFEARIGVDGRLIHLGTFSTPEEAHVARCAVLEKYHGEFGRIA